MKPFPVLACLWILLFLFVNVESHSSKQHQRVEFDSIPEITFRHPSYFVTRMDDKTLPRMKCEGSNCLGFPSVVHCINIGKSNGGRGKVEWKCTSENDPVGFQLGAVTVACEGWDRPGDPMVVQDHCILTFSLVPDPSKPSTFGASVQTPHRHPPQKETATATPTSSTTTTTTTTVEDNISTVHYHWNIVDELTNVLSFLLIIFSCAVVVALLIMCVNICSSSHSSQSNTDDHSSSFSSSSSSSSRYSELSNSAPPSYSSSAASSLYSQGTPTPTAPNIYPTNIQPSAPHYPSSSSSSQFPTASTPHVNVVQNTVHVNTNNNNSSPILRHRFHTIVSSPTPIVPVVHHYTTTPVIPLSSTRKTTTTTTTTTASSSSPSSSLSSSSSGSSNRSSVSYGGSGDSF